MKFAPIAALLLSSASSMLPAALAGSFEYDVVRKSDLKARKRSLAQQHSADINDALLSKAIPLGEYESKMRSEGKHVVRKLEDNNGKYDFYMDYDDMFSFSGYSLKYAKCQPVQYFSEEAIEAGEHSPMITEDVVILRLCPQSSCKESAQYGCYYNYAEYAISLADYLKIMLSYTATKRDTLCEWCENCQAVYGGGGGRRLEDGADDEGNNDQNNEGNNDENDGDNEDDNQYQEAQDYENANEDGYDDYNDANQNYAYSCSDYYTYCYDYDNLCSEEEDDDGGAKYMDYEDYIEGGYLNCAEANYNDYVYFVRPRCDGYEGTIKMAVYYDQFCVQYAGNDVSIKNFGLGFREGIFQEYYNGTCIECGVEDETSPPYFDTNTALCNKVHYASAKCTSDLLYDLFDGTSDSSEDSSECSYIESIRFGTYDEVGKLSAASTTSGTTWTNTEVSTNQKIMLAFSISLCVILVIYACYIHHSMTNLLIKSLSHRELLPPSRHRKSRRGSSNSSVRGGRKLDDDWEKPSVV